jgi:hypothetical protein
MTLVFIHTLQDYWLALRQVPNGNARVVGLGDNLKNGWKKVVNMRVAV